MDMLDCVVKSKLAYIWRCGMCLSQRIAPDLRRLVDSGAADTQKPNRSDSSSRRVDHTLYKTSADLGYFATRHTAMEDHLRGAGGPGSHVHDDPAALTSMQQSSLTAFELTDLSVLTPLACVQW